MSRSSDTEPQAAASQLARAMKLHQAGRFAESESIYRQLLAAYPRHAGTLSFLGMLECQTGRPAGLARMAQAVRLEPEAVSLRINFALRAADLGHLVQAEAELREALARAPRSFDANTGLGNLLRLRGDIDGAITCHRAAVAARPEHYGGYVNLGGALNAAKRHDESVAVLESARRLAPNAAEAHFNLGQALGNQNRTAESIASYRRAAELQPGNPAARWSAALALPLLYDRSAEIDDWRARWSAGLAELEDGLDLSDPRVVAGALSALQASTNFHLHYQGRNDRALQDRYGRLIARIAAAAHPELVEPLAPRRRRGRIRVGFASHFLRHHSIAKTHGNWIAGLDRARFDVHAIYTGGVRDAVTERLAAACDGFHHHPTVDRDLLTLIRGLDLDVLIYPDLGMEPAYQLLAALRLAPVQCNGLGHPVTSGLPTVDIALSSALMEPAEGDAQYTERLVRLPNLGFAYPDARHHAAGPARPREHDGPIYVCAQNLIKILPEQDHLFARIAAAVPNALFWFVSHDSAAVAEQFHRRLARAFAEQGVADLPAGGSRIRMLPRMHQESFYAMYRAADVYLDNRAWSGCNTTFEAIGVGLPVVTWPGPMMRGRHTGAILQQIGFEDFIAADANDYVELAVRLGADAAWREQTRRRLREACRAAFEDPTPIRGLERFLEEAVAGS